MRCLQTCKKIIPNAYENLIFIVNIWDADKYFYVKFQILTNIFYFFLLNFEMLTNTCMSKNKIYLWNIRFWRIFGFYILEILDTDKHKKNWIPDANQWLIFLCWNLRYWQVFEILFYRCVWDTDKQYCQQILSLKFQIWV